MGEKQAIIEDLQEAGWSMKKPRENEKISDLDLRHIFDKVDLNQDSYVNRMVSSVKREEGENYCSSILQARNFSRKRSGKV